MGAAGSQRSYQRHWTPVHLDVVVTDLDSAVSRAADAGARVEQDVRTAVWGKIAVLADPFGGPMPDPVPEPGPMSEHGSVEAERDDLALAASSFLDVLKAHWIIKP